MKSKRNTIIFRAVLAFVIFMSGLGSGWLLRDYLPSEDGDVPSRAESLESDEKYEFVNPLLWCEDGGREISRDIIPFKEMVVRKVDDLKKTGKTDTVALYFRDLTNGPWFGIGEREEFSPASLLKVPLLIAWLKQVETAPGVLSEKIVYKGDTFDYNSLERIKPSVSVQYGRTYTAGELLELMIVYSDNNATLLLGNHGWSFSKKVYNALALPQPNLGGEDYRLTVKQYASFFRILYNASYMNAELSNKALDLLASSDFRGGLVAGVPGEVKVAHKFGEREKEGRRQFHDCGIIYYPEHPYLLCIMTKGKEPDALISAVGDLSALVYGEVDRQMKAAARP